MEKDLGLFRGRDTNSNSTKSVFIRKIRPKRFRQIDCRKTLDDMTADNVDKQLSHYLALLTHMESNVQVRNSVYNIGSKEKVAGDSA
jgi:hypothetical protein